MVFDFKEMKQPRFVKRFPAFSLKTCFHISFSLKLEPCSRLISKSTQFHQSIKQLHWSCFRMIFFLRTSVLYNAISRTEPQKIWSPPQFSVFDQEGAAFRLPCASSCAPSSPLQISSCCLWTVRCGIFLQRLCSFAAQPLDGLSHWIQWQDQASVPLFLVVSLRHLKGSSACLWNRHRKCSSVFFSVTEKDGHSDCVI